MSDLWDVPGSWPYPERYKASGLEMIPTPCYHALTREPSPGTGWVYLFDNGCVGIKFNDDKVLTCTSQQMEDCKDWDRGDDVQDVILDSARKGLSIPEALARVKAAYGEPHAIVELSDVNEPQVEMRPVMEQLLK